MTGGDRRLWGSDEELAGGVGRQRTTSLMTLILVGLVAVGMFQAIMAGFSDPYEAEFIRYRQAALASRDGGGAMCNELLSGTQPTDEKSRERARYDACLRVYFEQSKDKAAAARAIEQLVQRSKQPQQQAHRK